MKLFSEIHLSDFRSVKWNVKCIYTILCKGKFYIGRSKDLRKRMSRHLWELKNNSHPNIILQRCFNKYGKDSLGLVILEVFDSDDKLIKIEKWYLDKYFKTDGNINLIPHAYGGHVSGKLHHNFGKRASQKTRNKMSLSSLGKNKGKNNGMFGKFGRLHHNSKLNEKQVIEILQLGKNGMAQRKIAKRYGVSRGAIVGVLSRKTWPHINLKDS